MPDSTGNRIDAMHGGSTSLAYNLNSHVGLVFDFGGFKVDSLQFTNTGAAFTPSRVVDADGSVFTFLFGPRVSFRDHDRLTPFLQVLGGAAHASDVTLDSCSAVPILCLQASSRRNGIRHDCRRRPGLETESQNRSASFSSRILAHPLPGSYFPHRRYRLAEQRAPLHGNRVPLRRESSTSTAQPFAGGLLFGRQEHGLCRIGRHRRRARGRQRSRQRSSYLFLGDQRRRRGRQRS